MTYDAIKEMIQTSQPCDWLFNEREDIFTFKHDLDLQIKSLNNRPFNEPWATSFPNKNASFIEYGIYYQNKLIETKHLVGIDGFLAIVPLLKAADNFSFSDEDYHFAEIVNRLPNLHKYLKRIQDKYNKATS